jgi:tRNA(Ile)-lysidine synthase
MSAAAVERAVRSLRDGCRVVLAVSGGRDSMVLLDAVARLAPGALAVVATFDHRTGPASEHAAMLVRDRAHELGVRVTSARARSAGRSEAELREARWDFLRHVGAAFGAPVATAHTRDDQIETVLMRAMRGAGARGLAGLRARSPIVRPLLSVDRASVCAYASAFGIAWLEDPSNASHAYFRNRVRHDLLPALLAVRPSLADDLLDISARAAELRADLDGFIRGLDVDRDDDGALSVASVSLSGYDPAELRTVWPAIAALDDITLDRRGTERLARFTIEAAVGDRMQLSGPVEIVRRRSTIALLRTKRPIPKPASLADGTVWGRWRFRIQAVVPRLVMGDTHSPFSALLDAQSGLRIRAWAPGDRMQAAGDEVPRRVRRFLRDAGLAGPDRIGWPVVLAGDEIVWIRGVRRCDAATVRPGRPGALYICDRSS